jgi:outer membrane autotransporter protein
MLESLGMGDWSGYKVLSLWVEAKYVTRPSYNPDITSNAAPTWNATTRRYDFTNVNATTLPYFLGIAPVSKTSGWYTRPYDAFVGSDEYQNWLNAWSASSYDIGAGREFPYTGLGWTWNWNTDPNLTGFALSEFIVYGNAEYYFKGLRPTLGYLFPVIAQNDNQASVANALDGIYDAATGDMRTTLDSMVALDDGGAIANTFEETSPARLNLLTRQIVSGIDSVADRINDRFGLLDSRMESTSGSVWTSSGISWSKGNSSTDGFGSNGTSDTFVLGWEKRSERSLSGLALSYNSNDLTWNGSTGSADAGATFLTGYHGCKLGKWRLGAEMGVGLIDINTHRQIPTLNQKLSGDNSATGFVAGISASLPFEKNNWNLTPSAGLLYTRLEQDSYTETGSALAMSINSQTVDFLRSDVGISFENRFVDADNHTATQSLKLHWLCPLTDRNARVSGAFSSAPDTLVNGVDRAVLGNTIQASYSISGEYGAGRMLSLGYDYAKELDGGLTSHSVNVNYAVEF